MNLMRRQFVCSLAALGMAPAAVVAQNQAAAPPEVAQTWPDARLQGRGKLSFLGLHIYDARLWVREGFDAAKWATQPVALELEYGRALVGKLIAERSLKEMRRIETVDDARAQRWLALMTQQFPDVKKGDRIIGKHLPGEAARFFVNGAVRPDVREPDFARAFFGIWLSPRTSEPALRSALLNTG
jgi:hypothetical protein